MAQDDESVLITNMRMPVKATNVLLNLSILPKLNLIPSDLLFLKEKIPGYNNLLTLATKTMKFGENEGLNFDAARLTEQAEGNEGRGALRNATEAAEQSEGPQARGALRNATEGPQAREGTERSEAREVLEELFYARLTKNLALCLRFLRLPERWEPGCGDEGPQARRHRNRRTAGSRPCKVLAEVLDEVLEGFLSRYFKQK